MVKKSTHAISVAIQAADADSTPQRSTTKFVGEDGEEQKLTNLRVQYAGLTIPSPDDEIKYVGGEYDYVTTRYLLSTIHDGSVFSGESMDKVSWMNMGPIYFHRVPKDGEDSSTNCEVTVQFSALPNKVNLLVFYHYRRVAKVKVVSGRVVEVISEDV
jgi:hypothetical protein